jgi:N-acetylglucosaminyl-diphospho-decaprenol L-rhamnosyltransferase
MSGIGIIIVTYNSESHIGACLDAAVPTGAEIVVVDNASHDATIAEVARRGVRVIANSTNCGFAAAVNQGFAVLDAPYVLLLNPDSVLIEGLEPLKEACDLPRAAGAGGRLLDSKGCEQRGFMVRRLPRPSTLVLEALLLNRVWPGNPVNRKYRGLDLDYKSRLEVEQPAGGFLMIKAAVWKELGGFDESFFPLWFEDVDFCRRAVDRGYRLFYVPQAVAKHTGAHSIVKLTLEMRLIYWYGSLLRYSAKHFHPAALRVVCVAVAAGSLLRMFGEVARERSLKSIGAYRRVLGLAGRRFFLGSRF